MAAEPPNGAPGTTFKVVREIADEIVDLIAARPGMMANEIAGQASMAVINVRTHLHTLRQKGRIHSVSPGTDLSGRVPVLFWYPGPAPGSREATPDTEKDVPRRNEASNHDGNLRENRRLMLAVDAALASDWQLAARRLMDVVRVQAADAEEE